MYEGWVEDMYTKQNFEANKDGVTQIERQPSGYLT